MIPNLHSVPDDDPAWRLRLTQARLRSLVDRHPDGVFAIDLEGRFTAINAEALVQSGGYAPDELLGTSFVRLLVEEDLPAVMHHFALLLEGSAQTFEVRFRRADGTVGELEIIGLPIVVDDVVVEIYGIAEDITERKQLLQALAHAREAAESASAAKTTFLATMSHEIRTPLTSVLAAAELLADSGLTDHQQQLVTVMERSGARLLRLLDEVLDFSRIDAGHADITALPFTLADVVDETMLILRSAIEDKGLSCTRSVAPDLPRQVVGDAGRIAQVLTNLVDNAAKFTHAGGVGVHVSSDGAIGDDGELAVRFTVTDSGIGLTEEQQGVVFDTFQQGDSSVTREYGGTGLGLAISRRLVTQMGGQIGVVSTPGLGSSFSFVLPLSPV